MTRNGVAASVAENKERNPGKYCPVNRCLWRTGGGYCPRHAGVEVFTGRPIDALSRHQPESLAQGDRQDAAADKPEGKC